MIRKVASAAALAALLAAVVGCNGWRQFYAGGGAPPLGTLSDPIWQNQERNAEMSDFVIYQHEFQYNSARLNTGGEDHVKQIARRLTTGQDAKVVIERSMTSPRTDTEFQYPVHPNPQLDMQRREVVVRSLARMGIHDADQRVMVAPAMAPGLTGNEAESSYHRAMETSGFGGGFGRFGGFFFSGF